MPAIKICHITSVHKWNDVRIFEKECVSLAKAGYNVSLIAVNGKSGIFDGVNVISVNINSKGRIQRMTKVVRAVYERAISVDADIYHIHDPELLRIAGKLKKAGKKVIYDSHEDLPRQIDDKPWINPIIRGIISRTVESYENRTASKLDGVITATPYIRDRFLKVNKNTIDINNFPILEKFETNTNWNERKNEICYLGGIFPSRGVEELIDSLENIDSRLNLAGNYSPESFRNILIAKKGWNKVNEYGFVDRKTIQQILNTSKIGIVTLHPTRAYLDSLPVKMFEYMAAGIPIIASDFPLWKHIVEKHHCGICVNPKNSNAIAEAIKYLLENDSEANTMGSNGRKAVEEFYNWQTEAEKLIAFYKRIK